MSADGAYGRPRCEWCDRVLTWREFDASPPLAHFAQYRASTGYHLDDVAEHTYDCENNPRQQVGESRL